MFHRPRQESGDTAVKDKETQETETSQKQGSPFSFSGDSQKSGNEAGKTTASTDKDRNSKEKSMNKNEKDNTENANNQDSKNAGRPLDIPGKSSGYQPPGNAPAQRAPGQYGNVGAYPGANSQASADTAGQGRRLIIGQGITMSGEIEACEYLVVEGTVEAALKGAKVLEIADSGTFYGTVEIEEATIAGRFEGDITVSGRLTVTASGSITGTISYSELAVEAGATLDGKISPLAGAGGSTSEKKSAKSKAKAKAESSGNDNKGEDSDESELPFSNTASAAAE